MLAQHQGGFFVLGCNLAMLAVLVRLWRDGDGVAAFRLLGSWVVAQILLIAIWACWLPWFIAQYHDHLTASGLHGHGNYMVDGAQLRDIVIGLLGTAYVWRLKLALFALFMAVAIPSCLMLARQRSDKRLVLVLFAAPLAVCLAGFAFVHPVFGYVIGTFPWLLMPYCMVLASGIAALPWRPAGAAVLGLLLAANALGLRNYYATPHQPLDQAAAFIAADARAGDGFMVSTTDATRKGIGYYLRRGGKDGLIDVSVFGPAMARDLDAALSHQRVWLILPLEEEPAVSLDVLRQRFTLAAETRFGDLRVFRFDQTTR